MDRLFCFFAIAECRVHDANSLQVRWQATVSCSQPAYSGLLMSCQTVDWVRIGIVVSSGSFPSTFLSVSEQGLASWYVEVDMGCSCLLPDLARRSALSALTVDQRRRRRVVRELAMTYSVA